ncbi:phosphatidylinositol 4-phosphate 5-kinase PIP5K [Acrasis kona]|uniref:Phosphatidylinositol 4-phosphate 5-kinase n=1 Tax=Acrasis kona TaxID=1008807 RepID=A0AAW2ZBJ7_9EUKA
MPTILFRGGKYEGDVENGVPHGKGVLVYSKSNHKYDGEWRNGRAQGKGVATGVVNDKIEREIQSYYKLHNKQHANLDYATKSDPSTPTSPTASAVPRGHFKYDGNWEEDEMSGVGVFTFPNGDVYDGDWKSDEPTGNGCYIWAATGDKYFGSFNNMLRSGFGSYMFANGNKYEGNWLHDNRNGKGTETFTNGNRYDGFWCRNMRHGDALSYVHLNNIDRKSAKKRRNSLHLSGIKKKGTTLNLSEYVVYFQQWEYNKKISEKELQITDDLPALNAPPELTEGSIEEQLNLLDAESVEVEQLYADMDKWQEKSKAAEDVYVQGLVLWLPNYWRMLESEFVPNYLMKKKLYDLRCLHESFSTLRDNKSERTVLSIKLEKVQEALNLGKEDIKAALVDICGVEPPPDNMVEDVFRMKLEVQLTQMKEELDQIDASMLKESKGIAQENEEDVEKRVVELEKKVLILEDAIETTTIHSTNAGFTADISMPQYNDLISCVQSHIKRLRVSLWRIQNAENKEERDKAKKLCKSESLLFQDLIKKRSVKYEEIHVDVAEVCNRSQGLCNKIIDSKN